MPGRASKERRREREQAAEPNNAWEVSDCSAAMFQVLLERCVVRRNAYLLCSSPSSVIVFPLCGWACSVPLLSPSVTCSRCLFSTVFTSTPPCAGRQECALAPPNLSRATSAAQVLERRWALAGAPLPPLPGLAPPALTQPG